MHIIELYSALGDDSRLQRDWERNQPRVDRAFEAPLIARTPREVATAALLAIKLCFEPAARACLHPEVDPTLIEFGRSQGAGGARLANIIEVKRPADHTAIAASIHSLRFYRERATASPLVRLPWSQAALEAVAKAQPDELLNPALRPTSAHRKAMGVAALARMLASPDTAKKGDEQLRSDLRQVPGLGPERADAVGVFAFRRPWPIVDQYLWSVLSAHQVITANDTQISGYDSRRKAFLPPWQTLAAAFPTDPNELAATLYLWADEAGRFGYTYRNGA